MEQAVLVLAVIAAVVVLVAIVARVSMDAYAGITRWREYRRAEREYRRDTRSLL